MAASEVKGSGRTWPRGNRRFAMRLLVSTDGVSGVAYGDDYPDDSGLDAPLRRKAHEPTNDVESVPGIVLHRILYEGFRAKS